MGIMRVCSGLPGKPCGRITSQRRCPACTTAHEALRPSRRAKGHYDGTWQRISAQAIREHPWCEQCRTPGTPDNPLTGDHRTPWSKGGRNQRSNVRVLCRACNSSKGARPMVGSP